MNDSESLHRQLLEAHQQNDTDSLATLYGEAGTRAEHQGNLDAACFYLTQAYIFALDSGLDCAAEYNRKLAGYGRDVLRSDLA